MKEEVEIKVWMIATLAMGILFVGAGILDPNRRGKQLSQRISELEAINPIIVSVGKIADSARIEVNDIVVVETGFDSGYLGDETDHYGYKTGYTTGYKNKTTTVHLKAVSEKGYIRFKPAVTEYPLIDSVFISNGVAEVGDIVELRRDCTEHPRFRGRPAQIIRIDDSRACSVHIKFIETDEEMDAWPADLTKPPK